MKKQRILEVLPYLPKRIAEMTARLNTGEWAEIEEIRLRVAAPLTVGIWGESCFVTPAGGITNYESDAYTVSAEEVQTAFGRVCENSVYAHLEEIRQGFITVRGGHRVGICGKTVCDGERIKTFREISSLNFRIAREVLGLGDGVMKYIISGRKVKSALLIAPPQMGKTTLLRDIIRQVSNRGFKVGVTDDRGELGAMYEGVLGNDLGAQTDVVDGAPKAEAVEFLLRTMSPKVIASDEIASKEDAVALCKAAGTGVKIIASSHGESVEDALSRRVLAPLFEEKVFDIAILINRDFSIPDGPMMFEAVEL